MCVADEVNVEEMAKERKEGVKSDGNERRKSDVVPRREVGRVVPYICGLSRQSPGLIKETTR